MHDKWFQEITFDDDLNAKDININLRIFNQWECVGLVVQHGAKCPRSEDNQIAIYLAFIRLQKTSKSGHVTISKSPLVILKDSWFFPAFYQRL